MSRKIYYQKRGRQASKLLLLVLPFACFFRNLRSSSNKGFSHLISDVTVGTVDVNEYFLSFICKASEISLFPNATGTLFDLSMPLVKEADKSLTTLFSISYVS